VAKNSQYLYIIRPTRLEMLTEGPTEREQKIVSQHFTYLQDLTQQGVAILVGRSQTADADSLGIIVYQASSEETARRLMENDPAVKQGVMRASFYPFRIALITADTSDFLTT
jgi:uncharacterized protein YciI